MEKKTVSDYYHTNESELFVNTNRKLIVDVNKGIVQFCCDKLIEFASSHFLYLRFQIRDIKDPNPINPCLISEDADGNRSWYIYCPFCGTDITVEGCKDKEGDIKCR